MNTIEDLLGEEELTNYKATEYPFNLSILYNALKQKQKTEPDYEVWVPLVYYACEQYKRSDNWPAEFRPDNVFISNKGKICSFRIGNKKRLLSASLHESGYWIVGLGIGKRTKVMVLHRALACSFLSLDRFLLSNEDAIIGHPKDLQVNHIDGIKGNFELDNLEWSTHSGNMQHAVDNGLLRSGKESLLTLPVKGKVEFGPYIGHEFILHGLADFKSHGFTQPLIVACCKGRKNTHRNCSWSHATDEDLANLPHGISDEIKASLDVIRRRLKI